jgi:hypothetical protein
MFFTPVAGYPLVTVPEYLEISNFSVTFVNSSGDVGSTCFSLNLYFTVWPALGHDEP